MCGRFAASEPIDRLVELFGIDQVPDELPGPRWNIAPTDPVGTVLSRVRDGELRRLLVPARWGLVPSWSKDPSGAARMINARVETVATKPAFRKAFASRRCLLPADGYYEWYTSTGDARPVKQPWFIHPSDSGVMAMAGLYEFWRAPDASWLTSVTIITTAARDAVGRLHDRMPMVVEPANWDAWLDPSFGPDAHALLTEPVDRMDFHPVSTEVNKVGNDGPQLVEPVAAVAE
jgi:putative SOS response-associated peptidase YedK